MGSVLAVDDHSVFRKFVRELVDATSGLVWIGEANSGEAAVDRVRELEPATLICLRLSIGALVLLPVALARLGPAKLGRELLGANGICDEYQVGRHMCNIESIYTYEGTHEIHTLVLGEHLTGIAAYK